MMKRIIKIFWKKQETRNSLWEEMIEYDLFWCKYIETYYKTYISIINQDEYMKALNFYYSKWFTFWGWMKWVSKINPDYFSQDFLLVVDESWIMGYTRRGFESFDIKDYREIFL